MIAFAGAGNGQAAQATVGDTVWVEVALQAAPGAFVRPQSWDLGTEGQVLGPAELVRQTSGLLMRYPVTFWTAGPHSVSVPGPIVVQRSGQSDTLPSRPMVIQIASVLPSGAKPDSLAPKPAADVIPAAERSILPVLLGEGLLLVLVLGIWWWRHRRRPAAPPPPPAARVPPPLGRWADAGERRAALRGWQRAIRDRLAAGTDPSWEGDAAPLLAAIERVEYGPADERELERLCRLASRWLTERPLAP